MLKIAISQFQAIPATTEEDQNKNFLKAKHAIIQAAQNKAQLIVFPEYFLTGPIDNNLHLASKEHKWINKFKQLALQYQIDIVPGTIVEEEESQSDQNPTLFNSAYYIDKSGKIISKYRKKNLWHSEKHLTPCSNENKVFEALDGIRIGMLICWDLAWPEAFRDLMKQNVELIIIPTFWTLDVPESKMLRHDPAGIQEAKLMDSLVTSRALEAESCVVFVNCAGRAEDGFLGHSAAALPLKGSLLLLDRPEEQLGFFEIDLDILKDAKEVYKISEEFNSKSFSKFY